MCGDGQRSIESFDRMIRLSPLDRLKVGAWTGTSFAGADDEAVIWMRRGLDANRNHSFAHFPFGAVLASLGELDQARATVEAGLALDPSFTIRRFRAILPSDNPTFLAGHGRLVEGMRLAGVPEG